MRSIRRTLLFVALCAPALSVAACKDEPPPQPTAAAPSPVTREEALRAMQAQIQEEARQNPDDPNNPYNLGNVYAAQGKHREAAGEYQKFVAQNPKDFDALTRLGDSLLALGQTEEAIAAYKRSVEAKPDFGEARTRLADAYAKAGRADEAARELAETRRLLPNEAGKKLLGENKPLEAIAELEKVTNKNFETYLLLGSAHARLGMQGDPKAAGHNNSALASYREAVRRDPRHANARFNLANAYSRLGKHAEAAEAFKEAARLQPNDADAYFNLGNEYDKLNRSREAAEAYAQAIKLNPSDADARYSLGLLHARNGDRAAALEQQEALKKLNPDSAAMLLAQIEKSAGGKQ